MLLKQFGLRFFNVIFIRIPFWGRREVIMERKLKTALLTIINDYNDIDKQIHDPCTSSERGLQLFAAKEALYQVLQHFANAEYVEYVDGQWRIKLIVVMERGG
ncbi:MAG: hypothetical protein K0R55_1323 [Sporomusa sp.]|jgi:hypothetical protein|nr:hypothetical protein [Sporomusa sp.]